MNRIFLHQYSLAEIEQTLERAPIIIDGAQQFRLSKTDGVYWCHYHHSRQIWQPVEHALSVSELLIRMLFNTSRIEIIEPVVVLEKVG